MKLHSIGLFGDLTATQVEFNSGDLLVITPVAQTQTASAGFRTPNRKPDDLAPCMEGDLEKFKGRYYRLTFSY